MSKVFEALQYARTERLKPKGLLETPSIPNEIPLKSTDSPSASFKIEREMFVLSQSISFLPNQNIKVIQFIGSQQQQGASTISREFARFSAEQHTKAVLLIDADRSHLSQCADFSLKPKFSLEHFLIDGGDLNKSVAQIGNSKLFLSHFFSGISSFSSRILLDSIDEQWDQIRKRFDLILIDSAPADISEDGLALCRIVDGVILVIEAEKSRSAVVSNMKERIKNNGGNLLGVVFNKQRYYIPEWIYKLL